MNPWEQFRQQVVEALQFSSGKDLSAYLEIPADPRHGDLACTAAFSLAQELQKSPVEIAKEFAKLDPTKFTLIEQAIAQGPYINFHLNIIRYRRLVIDAVREQGNLYGESDEYKGKHAVVEYPAVNPGKPIHIGHARNAVLGSTISRVLKTVGYDITRMDYIDDLGLQVAIAYWGMKHLKGAKLRGKFDQALGRLYVEAEQKHDKDQVRKYLRLMEEGDNKVAREVRAMSDRCLRAQHKTTALLNVHHDLLVWESDIAHSGLFAKALDKILKSPNIKRVAKGEKAGCIVVDLSAYEEFRQLKDTAKVLVRSDKTATYTGKDIAFHLWKFGIIADPFHYQPYRVKHGEEDILWTTASKGEVGRYKPADAIFNVIGMPQSQPQRTVYLVLKTLGYTDASDNYFHLAYEFVTLPDERFSGRLGTWIGFSADAVLREAIRRAQREVKKRNPDADSTFYKQVARAVGSAAIRYALLKVAVEKQIVFKWDDVLNFDGNAAPYLMYTHARACSILSKQAAPAKAGLDLLDSPWETELIKLIGRFPSVVLEIVQGMQREKWGTRIELFKLAEYTYSLSVAFNSFYNHCPVLKAESAGLCAARLVLVDSFRQVLGNALYLLGIEPLERI
ncbi:MAG: arginine--tRNA ligase [Promethearchaeota archaeon]